MSLLVPVDRKFYPKVQHIPPTLQQNWIGIVDTPPEITRDIVSRDTRSSQTSRDIGSLQTNKNVGSCIKIISDVGSDVSKDETFSVAELFRNRKRHLSNADINDPTTLPIKMCREILGQVDVDFSVLDEDGPSVDTELTKKIKNVVFEISKGNIKLQKIMKEYKHPANLLNLKPPKFNPEIESSQQYQSNTSFVMNKKKSLYSSQNYVIKAISILSSMTNSILKASDADIGGYVDHELCKVVREQYNTLEPHFIRVHKKNKTQPKKYSSFRHSCHIWTKTMHHNSIS